MSRASDGTAIFPVVSISLSSQGTQTVSAGTSATYSFNVNSGGGSVTFACTGLPQLAGCTFNPPSLIGSSAVNLTISTTKGGSAAPVGGSGPRPQWPMAWLLTAVAAAELLRRTRRLQWRPAMSLVGVLGIVMLAGCGSHPTPTPQPGTPAGTYQITVTATNTGNNTQATVPVTLVVQ
jgi:hypothetical protein